MFITTKRGKEENYPIRKRVGNRTIPTEFSWGKIIRRIARRINCSERTSKRIETKTAKRHESDGKTDLAAADRLTRGEGRNS